MLTHDDLPGSRVIDPVKALTHDHADLNRRVMELAAQLLEYDDDDSAAALTRSLGELREQLFLHFAREEEGLFPFVVDTVPELRIQVRSMEVAHDTICGGLARMYELASASASIAAVATVFQRFEVAYTEHARTEAELLAQLDARLDTRHRDRLATRVDGL